jgi:hypothetical protein
MLAHRFSLLEVIGKVLRIGLDAQKGSCPERWVELIEHLNEKENTERESQERKRDPDAPSPVG